MFDSTIKFKYSWRPYQAEVLKSVSQHLKDKRVHIVAAPGSGKTVLGLELARQVANPVLFLAPTITIKHQWIDRFISLFMPEGAIRPDWIKDNIYDLDFFNVATYQALHYAYKRTKNKEGLEDTDDEISEVENEIDVDIKAYDIIEELKKHNIKTIVLDEAHHLKAEWWKSLNEIVKAMPDVTLISLTATPPYDVEYSQWQRYIDLCGPIDAEISVPELVEANNLCPHQDYIYFNYPTDEEKIEINKYKIELANFIEGLKNDANFVQAILNHKFIRNFAVCEEEILENPQYYSSMLVFLNTVHEKIGADKVRVLGHTKDIPVLTNEWLEILLQGCIFHDRESYIENEECIVSIEQTLARIGVIEKGKVSIVDNKSIQTLFMNSVGKLNSINDIVEIEYSNLKDKLRMVILTDYIRKEMITGEELEVRKLGVFPIFREILDRHTDINLAILTGSIFAIPKNCIDLLNIRCADKGIPVEKLKYTELGINPAYARVETVEKYKNTLMGCISKLFASGAINIMIGTKALLGEGWDEPSINSLVLASFVGSYMLSNQMRGRAIRVNDNPRKTANIWHLVCVSDEDKDLRNSPDFATLERRFKGFVGIGYIGNTIENGIERIDIIPSEVTNDSLAEYKNQLVAFSNAREEMYDRWKRLINCFNKNMKLHEEIQMPEENLKNRFSIIDTGYAFKSLILLIVIALLSNLSLGILTDNALYRFIINILITVFGVRVAIQVIKAIKIGNPDKLLREISRITLRALCNNGFIETPYNKLKIVSRKGRERISCSIIGATPNENTIFVNAIKEIFSKVEDQRYIIVKDSILTSKLYYSVPSLLSSKKELANSFFELWNKRIEKSRLIYTKNQEGRKILLNARKDSFDYRDKVTAKQKVISEWE